MVCGLSQLTVKAATERKAMSIVFCFIIVVLRLVFLLSPEARYAIGWPFAMGCNPTGAGRLPARNVNRVASPIQSWLIFSSPTLLALEKVKEEKIAEKNKKSKKELKILNIRETILFMRSFRN